jgi:hypothetical protein
VSLLQVVAVSLDWGDGLCEPLGLLHRCEVIYCNELENVPVSPLTKVIGNTLAVDVPKCSESRPDMHKWCIKKIDLESHYH